MHLLRVLVWFSFILVPICHSEVKSKPTETRTQTFSRALIVPYMLQVLKVHWLERYLLMQLANLIALGIVYNKQLKTYRLYNLPLLAIL